MYVKQSFKWAEWKTIARYSFFLYLYLLQDPLTINENSFRKVTSTFCISVILGFLSTLKICMIRIWKNKSASKKSKEENPHIVSLAERRSVKWGGEMLFFLGLLGATSAVPIEWDYIVLGLWAELTSNSAVSVRLCVDMMIWSIQRAEDGCKDQLYGQPSRLN